MRGEFDCNRLRDHRIWLNAVRVVDPTDAFQQWLGSVRGKMGKERTRTTNDTLFPVPVRVLCMSSLQWKTADSSVLLVRAGPVSWRRGDVPAGNTRSRRTLRCSATISARKEVRLPGGTGRRSVEPFFSRVSGCSRIVWQPADTAFATACVTPLSRMLGRIRS